MRVTDLASPDQYNYPELNFNYLTRSEESISYSTVRIVGTSGPETTSGNLTLCKDGVNERNQTVRL